jgi:hypothetical protein
MSLADQIFDFHAGPLTGNAPLPDNQIHFAKNSEMFPLVFPLKEKSWRWKSFLFSATSGT